MPIIKVINRISRSLGRTVSEAIGCSTLGLEYIWRFYQTLLWSLRRCTAETVWMWMFINKILIWEIDRRFHHHIVLQYQCDCVHSVWKVIITEVLRPFTWLLRTVKIKISIAGSQRKNNRYTGMHNFTTGAPHAVRMYTKKGKGALNIIIQRTCLSVMIIRRA